MAIPLGPDRAGSLSGMFGRPVPFEYRTVTGVDGLLACVARVSFAASGDGVNVPVHISPFACAGLKPGCSPNIVSKASSSFWARAGFFIVPVGLRFCCVSIVMSPHFIVEPPGTAPYRTPCAGFIRVVEGKRLVHRLHSVWAPSRVACAFTSTSLSSSRRSLTHLPQRLGRRRPRGSLFALLPVASVFS